FRPVDVASGGRGRGPCVCLVRGGTRRKSALIPADTSPCGMEPSRPLSRPPRVAEIVNGNSAMRETEARFWMLQTSSLSRALRFAAIALGIGLVMAAGPLRAADDEDEDDKTFEEKIIEGIMRGIGVTNMDNRGIEYRERSPLVVPPKLDLPPPAATAAVVKARNRPTA